MIETIAYFGVIISVLVIIVSALTMQQQINATNMAWQYFLGQTYGWNQKITGAPSRYVIGLFSDSYCQSAGLTPALVREICLPFPPFATILTTFSILLAISIAYLILRKKNDKNH